MSNIYVAKTGSNINTGSTPELSVLTISQAINLANSGDIIYIQEGIYPEYLEITKSGITLLPYQNQKVTITAYDLIPNSLWKEHEVGIYKAVLDSTWDIGLGRNDVYSPIDELQEARWPKVANRLDVRRDTCAISTDGSTNITTPIDASNNYLGYYIHPQLSQLPNMTGAWVYMVPGYEWWIRAGEIVSHTGERIDIKYKYSGFYNPEVDRLAKDDPFFIWNKYELMTEKGDYYFDINTDVLYIKSEVKPLDVYMRKRDRVIAITGADIKIEGIKIMGRVETTDTSSNMEMIRVDIERGHKDRALRGGYGALDLRGNGHKVKESHIYDTGGAFMNIRGSNHIIQSNVFNNDGYAGESTGVQTWGAVGVVFTRNTIYETVSLAISVLGIASEYSYNHTYQIGRLTTDLAAINAWNSGDTQGTVIKWNHVHDVVAYSNPIGSHNGGKGIRLDGGGSPKGCSNFKIHNNLCYRVTNYSYALWRIEEQQERYGDAQIYFVNNTGDNNFLLFSTGVGPLGFNGVYCHNNLVLDMVNNLDSNIPTGISFTDNFLTRRQLPNNYQGYAKLKNWIPQEGSPLIDKGIVVPGITNTPNPDIGWMEAGQSIVWGGAIELLTSNVEVQYNQPYSKLVIETKVPGRSLPEDTLIRINGANTYSIYGRTLNPNHTVNHFFDITENGESSLEISFNNGISFEYLTTIYISRLYNTQIYKEGNELVIKGGGYFTQTNNTLDIKVNSLSPCGNYVVLRVDTSSIPQQDLSTLRVRNKADGSEISYWLEDIEVTDRRNTPLHLKMNELQLTPDGGVEIEIAYGGEIINQPTLMEINRQVGELIDKGNPVLWYKSHMIRGEEGQLTQEWKNYDLQGYSLSQGTVERRPKYEVNSLNGWPGVKFNTSSLKGTDLGNGDYTLLALYKGEENPTVTYPRLISGGIPEGQDYTNGIQLLPTLNTNNLQIATVDVARMNYASRDFNSITIGSSYKNPLGSNFKGSIYEVIILKGVRLLTPDLLTLREYLRVKYGIYPQPTVDVYNTSSPLTVKFGTSIYTTDDDLSLIQNNEIRVPYQQEKGTYELIVTNPNKETASIYITFSYMEILHNNISISPSSTINYPSVFINEPHIETFIIKNNSEVDTLTLDSLLVPLGFSLVGSFPLSLTPLSEIPFSIQLDASQAGLFSGVLSFNTSDIDIPIVSISLNGEVLEALIEVTSNTSTPLPPNSTLYFDEVTQGDISNNSFTVLSTGTGNLIIDNLTLTNPEFSITNPLTLPLVIGSNSSETINVSLDTSIIGSKEGTLSFTTNDINYPIYSFNLSALVNEIAKPLLEVLYSGVSLVEGQVISLGSTSISNPLSFTLDFKNIGNALLTPSDITVPTGYSLTSPITSIPPGDSLPISIQLDATSKGTFSGLISITYNPTITFGITGKVLAPILLVSHNSTPILPSYALNFPSSSVNSIPPEEIILIENQGDSVLTISSISISSPFSLPSLTFPIDIVPGQSIPIIISLNPSISGSYTSEIVISSNDTSYPSFSLSAQATITSPTLSLSYLTQPLSPNQEIDYLRVARGEISPIKSLTILNEGEEDLVISSIDIPLGFSISSIPLPLVIPPSNTFELPIELDTQEMGTYEGDLIFNSNDEINPEYPIKLKGIIEAPRIEISNVVLPLPPLSTLDYGSIELNRTVETKVLTISNTGNIPLNVLDIIVSPSFALSPLTLPLIIPPASSQDIGVTLISTNQAGEVNSTLEVVSDDTIHSPYSINLKALITAPTIEVSHTSVIINPLYLIDFGIKELNSTQGVRESISISNKGNQDLIVFSINTSEGYYTEPNSFPYTISPSENLNLDIVLNTAIPGNYIGSVEISSNDSSQSIFRIETQGVITGAKIEIRYKGIPIEPNGWIDFLSNKEGEVKEEVIEIINTGNEELIISEVVTSNPFSTQTVSPLSVLPQESINLALIFNSNRDTSIGEHLGNITLSTNAFEGQEYQFNLKATITPSPVLSVRYLSEDKAPLSVIDFGSITKGTDIPLNLIELENIGSEDLVITSIVLPPGFFLNPPVFYPITLTPSFKLGINLDIDTSTVGIQEGDLIIESNDETNASYPLHLKTFIVIPKIELTLNNETLINASNLISEFNLNSNPILPLVINNKGEGDLLINNISLPLGYSLLTPISNYPFTLLPSQQLPLDIVIASDRVNTYGGDLRIETNDETHPVFTIHLLHDILGPIIEVRKNGELVLNTSQLIFENHSINTPVVKTLLITNKGNEAITLDRLVLPLGYSSVSLLSPLSLAINESTELEIVSQSSEPGNFSGRLEIYIPEMIEPIYILDLTTVITSALIEVSQNGMILSTGDTLLFEEQTEGLPANGKTIIISNPGEDSLLISEVTISNPWSINPPLLLPIEIASNETREIAINVDTSLSGVYDTSLVFTTNAYNEPNYELKLYVRVITPPPVLEVVYNQTPLLPDEGVIDFGSLTIGSESLRNFSFNNKGGGELIINTLSLPNGYQFNPEITFPLVIKESLTIGISMDTTVPHVYEGLVFIGSNDILNSPFIFLMTGEVLGSSIKLIDESNNSPLANEDSLTFGSLEEKTTLDNTRSILITNEGNQPLTLNSIELPPGYSLSPSLMYPYEVLDGLALTIILDTNTPGEYNGSLVINSDAYIDSSLSLNLTATITPLQPLIEITHLTTSIISGYILDYGQVEQGQEINQSLVITNKGKGNLLITQLISSYPYDLTLNSSILDPNFLTPFNPLTVIPNETVEVFISLVDNTLGLKEGKITINTNDINSSVIEILVKGQIVEVPYAKLTVSKTGEILSNGSYIDIGKTKENVPHGVILSLTNDGIKDLEISSIVLPEGIISDLFTPVSLIPSEVLFITLGLDGQGIGIKEGIVEILTNDESSPFTLNIYGEVEGTPLLSITSDTGEMIQSPIDIGLVEYNSTISKALILKNEGTGVLVIDSFTSTSPSLSLPNLSLPLSLLPNEQAEIILQMEASTPELYEETISLNTNLDFNPLVELTIIGQVFTNNLVVLYNQSLLQIGDIITFDERVVPESSILSLILKNEGQVDITLNDWLITPPFSYLLTPPSQLKVGETKEVSLKLESTVANLYEGTLSFHLGDSQSTLYNYSLIGNLLSPYYELSIFNNQLPLTPGSTLSFGVTPDGVPTTEVLTLRNTGNTPYDLTSITLPPGYSSTFSSPITIPVLGEVNIEVQLLEEVPGIYEGQLSLDGSREFTINLSGEVYLVLEPKLEVLIEGQPLPDSIDYGSTPLNESLIQTLTINNSGDGDLIIDSISLPPGYTYLGTLPLIIPPSSSSTLELQFNATQQGITQGLVELHTNQVDTPVISFEVKAEVLVGELFIDIDDSPLYPTNLIQFGSNYTPISKLLTLSNIGTAPITIYSISVPLGFSYIPSIPLTIDIGSSISLSISLDAIEAGEYLGQVVIDSNAINSSFILYLEGIMNEIPYTLLQVHASGVLIESRWDIGKIEKGELISKEVVLSNLGNEELSLSNIEIGEGVYRLVYPSLPLVLGQPITVNLEIYSEELGIFESQWRLIDSEGKVYQIDLNVEVEAGILSVVQFSTPLTPDSLIDMGINYLNQSFIPVNLTLSNIGNIPLLDLTSTHSSPLFSSTPIIPNSLQPNASIGTTINFLPLSQGVHTSLLTFLGSDKPSSSESLFTLNLKGEALAPLNSYIQIDPMEGIAIPLNGTADILIKNNSEYPIVIKELTGGIPGVSSISALPITIAPGESISLPITYRTNETPVEGEVSINIELESNIGDNTGIDNIEVKGFLVPPLPQNIGLGATDTLRIIGEYPEGIVITKIPEGIVIKLGDTEVVEGQTISEDQIGNLKVFSINPGIYTIEYSSGSNPYSLDLQVESLPLTTNETGYIPIPRYDGLYPTSPYWIEGDTYWVLVEEGMTLTSTPTEPSSLPANLVFDVVSKDDEPDWRNNKPLTVVNEETQELNVLIVGTIDKGDFDTASMSRDIFINYSTLPDTILSINEVILTKNSITIQGIVYTLSLEAGVIRFSMTPNSIKVINNGVVKRNISSTYLWLPRGSIYSLDVTDNNLMTELIVSVDEASILINTYMTRKYIEKGEYISLLTA